VMVSRDALLSTLLFLLPGFVAVGAFVLPFRWLNSPDLSRSTFVVLALTLSVPLNWLFSVTEGLSPQWLRDTASIPHLGSPSLSRADLLGVTLLYLLAAAVGLVASAAATFMRNRRWRKAGTCVRPSRDSVWHGVLKSRASIPWVVAVLDRHAYYGKLLRFTTTGDDMHIYVTHVQVLPLDEATGVPIARQAEEPPVDGVLLRLDSLTALWFVT
jgi:hypothetical protein